MKLAPDKEWYYIPLHSNVNCTKFILVQIVYFILNLSNSWINLRNSMLWVWLYYASDGLFSPTSKSNQFWGNFSGFPESLTYWNLRKTFQWKIFQNRFHSIWSITKCCLQNVGHLEEQNHSDFFRHHFEINIERHFFIWIQLKWNVSAKG